MKYPIKEDFKGKEKGQIDLLDEVFKQEVNTNFEYELVKNQEINKRQGNASTKNIAKMKSRSTKKPWRQKGTGNARAGTRKSPLWVGGAVAHGPQKRDFSYRVPKQFKRKALFSFFSGGVANGTLHVLDDIELNEFKTKQIHDLFSPLLEKSDRNRILLIVSCEEKCYSFVKKSADNIVWLKVANVESMEAKDIFYADHLVLSKTAVEKLNKVYSPEGVAIEGEKQD